MYTPIYTHIKIKTACASADGPIGLGIRIFAARSISSTRPADIGYVNHHENTNHSPGPEQVPCLRYRLNSSGCEA